MTFGKSLKIFFQFSWKRKQFRAMLVWVPLMLLDFAICPSRPWMYGAEWPGTVCKIAYGAAYLTWIWFFVKSSLDPDYDAVPADGEKPVVSVETVP